MDNVLKTELKAYCATGILLIYISTYMYNTKDFSKFRGIT